VGWEEEPAAMVLPPQTDPPLALPSLDFEMVEIEGGGGGEENEQLGGGERPPEGKYVDEWFVSHQSRARNSPSRGLLLHRAGSASTPTKIATGSSDQNSNQLSLSQVDGITIIILMTDVKLFARCMQQRWSGAHPFNLH